MKSFKYILFGFASLSFSIQVSFASDFLDEVKGQYHRLFSSAKEQSGSKRRTYPNELREKLPKYREKSAPDLLPAGMLHPRALDQYTKDVFGIHNIDANLGNYLTWEVQNRRREEFTGRLQDVHLEILRSYWKGYIAFLEQLEGNPESWEKFSRDFDSEFEIPDFDTSYRYGAQTVQVEYSRLDEDRLKESNKRGLLPVFLVHYSLGTFFQENKAVSPRMRIKSILLWKQIDPEFKFFETKNYKYRYGHISFDEKRKNLLPETFEPGLIEDQEIGSYDFHRNSTLVKIFGSFRETDWTQTSFQKGLTTLLLNHKQELIQVLHSLLQIHSADIYGQMTLRFIAKIAESEDSEFLGLALGEHASFRNKGRITLVIDELALLSKELLIGTARAQKERLKEMEACLLEVEESHKAKMNQAKRELIGDKARCLLGSLRSDVDVQGWFKTFKVNPLLSFEENQDSIKTAYHKLTLELHPDRHPEATEEEKNHWNSQMANITAVYKQLTAEETYSKYLQLCWGRAVSIATHSVIAIYGSL